jgi:hypothetical protein
MVCSLCCHLNRCFAITSVKCGINLQRRFSGWGGEERGWGGLKSPCCFVSRWSHETALAVVSRNLASSIKKLSPSQLSIPPSSCFISYPFLCPLCFRLLLMVLPAFSRSRSDKAALKWTAWSWKIKCNYQWNECPVWSRGSSVSVVTRLPAWNVPARGSDEILFSLPPRPDRLWGTSSLPLLPGVKRPGLETDHLVPRLRIRGTILLLFHTSLLRGA